MCVYGAYNSTASPDICASSIQVIHTHAKKTNRKTSATTRCTQMFQATKNTALCAKHKTNYLSDGECSDHTGTHSLGGKSCPQPPTESCDWICHCGCPDCPKSSGWGQKVPAKVLPIFFAKVSVLVSSIMFAGIVNKPGFSQFAAISCNLGRSASVSCNAVSSKLLLCAE